MARDRGWQDEDKQYTLQFSEGYLVGKASKVILDMYVFTYAFDANGIPTGLWTCRLNRPQDQWIYTLRYADGALQESYTENEPTGDRNGLSKGAAADDGLVGYQLLDEINKLLLQPYDYKEMPIRSSLSHEQLNHNNRIINSEGNMYGFLGYRTYHQR